MNSKTDNFIKKINNDNDNDKQNENKYKYNYKTELCKYFNNGKCNKGDKCLHAHGEDELRCKFYSQGNCRKGDECKFIHEKREEKCSGVEESELKINDEIIDWAEIMNNDENIIYQNNYKNDNFNDVNELINNINTLNIIIKENKQTLEKEVPYYILEKVNADIISNIELIQKVLKI